MHNKFVAIKSAQDIYVILFPTILLSILVVIDRNT